MRKLCVRQESVRDCAEAQILCGIVRAAGGPFEISFPASQPIAGRLARIIVTATDMLVLTLGYFSLVLFNRCCGPVLSAGIRARCTGSMRAGLSYRGQFSPGRTRARNISLFGGLFPAVMVL